MTGGNDGLEVAIFKESATDMYRQCTDVVDHQALCSAGSSPYHFAEPGEASCCHDLLKSLSQQDNNAETSEFRGDVPPKKAKSPLSPGVGDSGHLHETTVGSQGYFSGTTADYSSYSYRSKIATFSSGISEAYTKPGLQRATFKGGADKTDRGHMHKPWNVDKCIEPVESPDAAVHRDQITSIDPNQQKPHLQIAKHEKVIKPDEKGERKVVDCYRKTSYAVLIGNTVRVYDTKMYAALPLHNKCMVKERVKDASGNTRVKMSLKTLQSSAKTDEPRELTQDNDDLETDGDDMTNHYYHKNSNSPGYIIFTRDKRFRGNMKYPLPTEKATIARIGKGGNGFVFTLYHEKKHYAVKKTVYRSNEVNVHSALKHRNILQLAAVLIGEKHERHSGKFYCFHFMARMDCDLRQILSTKEIGCLKHYYTHCSKDPEKFETAYNNIKYILLETLKGLEYIHSQGYVHRDVKASNIMIKTKNCKGSPLHCTCSTKFEVRLGDFDSAGAVPGLGIKEPTDQLIKFASILPLGTPGYRAPEVSMHITLSGPYETLYTTAVDMWSFGCLCLNICIGKTAALKQREEASLLLSQSHYCSTELWEKTTKIGELQKTRPFNTDNQLIALVRSCLQVDSKKRPTALQAQQYFVMK